MKWDRELDQVEAKALHDLQEAGYTAVDKKHIIHFREIYDFICRFADPSFAEKGVIVEMENGDPIPGKTRGIVNTIGYDKLYLYFSPQAYPKKFFRFCEKLIKTGRIRSVDYLHNGVIATRTIPVEVSEYEA